MKTSATENEYKKFKKRKTQIQNEDETENKFQIDEMKQINRRIITNKDIKKEYL